MTIPNRPHQLAARRPLPRMGQLNGESKTRHGNTSPPNQANLREGLTGQRVSRDITEQTGSGLDYPPNVVRIVLNMTSVHKHFR
jgi:hypothetical protein